MAAIHQKVTVQKDGLLEIHSPDLIEGDIAEVVVTVRHASSPTSPAEPDTDWRSFVGCFKGHHGSSDNDSIDADLAAEYGATHENEE